MVELYLEKSDLFLNEVDGAISLKTMKHIILKVWIDDSKVYAVTADGLEASYAFSEWPLLRNATQQQRANFYLSYAGIHWPDIDEDLSFEGMFNAAGLCERTSQEVSVCYLNQSTQCRN